MSAPYPGKKYDPEEIKRTTDIVEVVSHYIPLKKRGADYVGLCPVHEESTPSFHVTRAKAFAFCYGCGCHFDVISFLMEMENIDFPTACDRLGGRKMQFIPKLSTPPGPPIPERITSKPPADAPTPSMHLQELGDPIQIYPLRDVDGSLICYEARYNDPKDKSRMWSWGARPGNRPRWECRHPNEPRPLYGLDRLGSMPPDAPVLITEGPKKADAAHRLLGAEYVCLSWTGGASRMKAHDYSLLAGRACLLFPDADKQRCKSERDSVAYGCPVGEILPYEQQPGPKAMYYLAEKLHGLGCKVRLVNVLGDMPNGWDIADADADGWSRDDIVSWMEPRTSDYSPGPDPLPEEKPDEDWRIYQPNPRVKGGKVLSTGQNHYVAPPGSEEALLASIVGCMASDIKMEPVRWLWPGRIAKGKISILVGDPGLGKSQICASLAAVITTGGTWPTDRTPCEPGSVIILSAEDDANDTIAPRLAAAGADRSKVYLLSAVNFHTEDDTPAQRAFSVMDDLAKLEARIRKMNDVRLLVIDPISAYMGMADSYKNAEVRGLMVPLQQLAQKYGVAVLLISHLTKSQSSSALMRVQGSVALPAVARAVWGITKDPDDPDRRLFVAIKNNLGKDNTALAYKIESCVIPSDDEEPIETSYVMWENEHVAIGEEAFSEGADEHHDKIDAKMFLKSMLATGPVPSAEVQRDAVGAGYSMSMLHRMKRSLGIQVRKFGKSWYWLLPGQEVHMPNAYRDREN